MKKYAIISLALAMLTSNAISARELDVSITNLTQGIYFTPLLLAAHDTNTHLFEPGTSASANLQAMAEGGDISGLSADLATVSANVSENPAAGLLAPGSSTSTIINTDAGNDYFSLVAMLLPTNDGFVGIDALNLPAMPGTYTFYLNGYDAGTEANDEIINGAGTPGAPGIPVDPGASNGTGATGVTTIEANAMIHIHRGNLGDTDLTGGSSDVDSRVHRWLNPIAKLVITIK
jgi:hypothetical protein